GPREPPSVQEAVREGGPVVDQLDVLLLDLVLQLGRVLDDLIELRPLRRALGLERIAGIREGVERPAVVDAEAEHEERADAVAEIPGCVVAERVRGEVDVDGVHGCLPSAAPSAGIRAAAVLGSISAGKRPSLAVGNGSSGAKSSDARISAGSPI